MKNLKLLIMLLALQSCLIGAGENSQIEANKNYYFPNLTGIDLEGNEKKLPQSFVGDLNIVVVAFKREQQSNVDTWIKATEVILKENPQINFYEIPLIYELNTFSRAWINNGMRFGVPDPVARKRTITVYTDRNKFFEITKMKEENIYTLLLNKDGKILWQVEGVADQSKIKNLLKAINNNDQSKQKE